MIAARSRALGRAPRSRAARAPLSALAAAAWLLAAGGCGPSPEPVSRPSIVLVSIDSLRPDHLGCYGYRRPTSPTLDALAARGVRFENAVSTSSWTLPSHAAMFTGLYDSAHGLTDNGLRLGEGHRTLAEELSRAGYHTAGFFGGPYLHPTFGLGQGFDVYESCMTTVPDSLPDDQIRNPTAALHGSSHADVTSPRTLEAVERWAAGRDPSEPYFLFLHLWDVHYDFVAPPEYVELFDPAYGGELTGVDFMTNPAVNAKMSPRDFRHLLALYDAEIRWTDEHLGRILTVLEARGLMQDTLVVVTSDHGEEFFEHGTKGHNRTLWEEVVRVPLIVSWPGKLDDGRAIGDLVRLVDLMPTLLGFARVDARPETSGRDLRPLLAGRELPPEPALLELGIDGRQLRALRTQRHKVVQFDWNGQAPLAFDLVADPDERAGVGLTRSGLDALLEVRRGALELGRRVIDGGAREVRPDPAIEQQLRDLGYVGGGEDRDR